ncbi:MAG: YkgB family protein [Bryobacteraceae bacterium]
MALIEQTSSSPLTPSRETKPDIEKIGEWVIRYALFLVIFWVGCLKFTAYEAQNVFPLVSHSPLLSWTYSFLSLRSLSGALGTVEIIIALLIASRPISPKLSIVGSWGAICMFLTTLSFLLSTPGVWQPGYGFLALAGSPGQFLAKDTVLLGAAIWTLGESLGAMRAESALPR